MFLFFYVTHKKVVFRIPLSSRWNRNAIQSCGKLLNCPHKKKKQSVSPRFNHWILFSRFLFSVLSRQSWRQGRGTDLHLRCNSRIISWVSTATFQLFGMFSLVSSSPYCVLFTNTLYVTTRLYSTRKHIKQNKSFFILAHAPPPNCLTAHCEKPNRKKKKKKSGHSTPVSAIAVACFIPVVSPNTGP